MGSIYYVMGKSASGKDTIYRELHRRCPQLREIIPYTTRPIREGERDGVQYHFCSTERLRELENEGRVIEVRTYQTVCGPWSYATVDDGEIDLSSESYIAIGTLESYEQLLRYFGADRVVPIYVELEDGLRLERALARERRQQVPKYDELCRRFLADQSDFSEQRLHECGISRRYVNDDLERCVLEICCMIECGAEV